MALANEVYLNVNQWRCRKTIADYNEGKICTWEEDPDTKWPCVKLAWMIHRRVKTIFCRRLRLWENDLSSISSFKFLQLLSLLTLCPTIKSWRTAGEVVSRLEVTCSNCFRKIIGAAVERENKAWENKALSIINITVNTPNLRRGPTNRNLLSHIVDTRRAYSVYILRVILGLNRWSLK